MKLISSLTFSAALLAILAACSEQSPTQLPPQQAVDRLILSNGLVNIPVLPGSTLTENCGNILADIEPEKVFKCIAFPRGSDAKNNLDWDTAYTRELVKDEWKWAGGEGNAYYFEKPIDEFCSHSLSMIGWIQGTAEQEENFNRTGDLDGIQNFVLIFGIDNEQKCSLQRRGQ